MLIHSIARFDQLEGLAQDLAQTSRSWDTLRRYLAEEKTLADEDWLSFTNVYQLQVRHQSQLHLCL